MNKNLLYKNSPKGLGKTMLCLIFMAYISSSNFHQISYQVNFVVEFVGLRVIS